MKAKVKLADFKNLSMEATIISYPLKGGHKAITVEVAYAEDEVRYHVEKRYRRHDVNVTSSTHHDTLVEAIESYNKEI